MSKESVQFIEMIRDAAQKQPQSPGLHLFCSVEFKETWHRLVSTRGKDEVYACSTPQCPGTRHFTVR